MTQRFEECLKFVLKWEGGWTPPQKGDPNPTNYGIIQSVYDAYRERKRLPLRSVRFITMDEVREIYWEWYWLRSKADKLPQPLDLVHFDTSVNMGVGAAGKLLQRSINDCLPKEKWLKVDGVIGNATLSAAKSVDAKKVCAAYIKRRRERYHAIARANPEKQRFLRGWLNRVNDLAKTIA